MQATREVGARREFSTIRAMCAIYLAATVVTLGFLAWKEGDRSLVTEDAWVHGVILLVFAVVLVRVATRAASGDRRAYLRLRIIGFVVPAASVVEALIPGLFPGWMRVEQLVYGVWLLAVVALASRPAVRRSFART
jgi:CDP-diglyceride synthetase